MKAEQPYEDLERDLERLFTALEPDAAFPQRMQEALRKAPKTPKKTNPNSSWTFFTWPRLRWALAALLLALTAAVLAIGPQRVWAMAVEWLSGGTGFNSEIGFAPAGATLELAAPVEARRGTAVFRMGKVLFMQGREISMDYAIELDPAVYAGLPDMNGDPTKPGQAMVDAMPVYTRYAFDNVLLTPEQVRLRGRGGMVYKEDGKLISRQTYEEPGERLYTRYELVLPAELTALIDAGDVEWVIPFDLKPVEMIAPAATSEGGQTPTPAMGATTRPTPEGAVYQPTGAGAAAPTFDIRLTDVAVTPAETAVRLFLDERGYNFQTVGFDLEYIHLEDELGNRYAALPKDAANDDLSHRTVFFEPLKAGATHLRVVLDMVYVQNPFQGGCAAGEADCQAQLLRFAVPLGQATRPGMSFASGEKLEIPGFPGQSLTLEKVEVVANENVPDAALNASVEWSYAMPASMKLVGVQANLLLDPQVWVNGCGGASHSAEQLGAGRVREVYTLLLDDGSKPEIKDFAIDVCGWEVELTGPWTIDWDIPR